MTPKGHPIKKYTVVKTLNNLTNGEVIYEFSDGNYYKVETISRDDRYEIKILDEIDIDEYIDVLEINE